jgi:hypothetical protein
LDVDLAAIRSVCVAILEVVDTDATTSLAGLVLLTRIVAGATVKFVREQVDLATVRQPTVAVARVHHATADILIPGATLTCAAGSAIVVAGAAALWNAHICDNARAAVLVEIRGDSTAAAVCRVVVVRGVGEVDTRATTRPNHTTAGHWVARLEKKFIRRPVAVIIDAVALDLHRPRMNHRIHRVAVHLVAVVVAIGVGGTARRVDRATLAHGERRAILWCTQVDAVVCIVAIVATSQQRDLAIAIGIVLRAGRNNAVAILVDEVAADFGATKADARVAIIAVAAHRDACSADARTVSVAIEDVIAVLSVVDKAIAVLIDPVAHIRCRAGIGRTRRGDYTRTATCDAVSIRKPHNGLQRAVRMDGRACLSLRYAGLVSTVIERRGRQSRGVAVAVLVTEIIGAVAIGIDAIATRVRSARIDSCVALSTVAGPRRIGGRRARKEAVLVFVSAVSRDTVAVFVDRIATDFHRERESRRVVVIAIVPTCASAEERVVTWAGARRACLAEAKATRARNPWIAIIILVIRAVANHQPDTVLHGAHHGHAALGEYDPTIPERRAQNHHHVARALELNRNAHGGGSDFFHRAVDLAHRHRGLWRAVERNDFNLEATEVSRRLHFKKDDVLPLWATAHQEQRARETYGEEGAEALKRVHVPSVTKERVAMYVTSSLRERSCWNLAGLICR